MMVPAADAPPLLALRSTAAHDVPCDVHMPGPTGLWLAERIRNPTRPLAIVIATADATLQPAQTFRKASSDMF